MVNQNYITFSEAVCLRNLQFFIYALKDTTHPLKHIIDCYPTTGVTHYDMEYCNYTGGTATIELKTKSYKCASKAVKDGSIFIEPEKIGVCDWYINFCEPKENGRITNGWKDVYVYNLNQIDKFPKPIMVYCRNSEKLEPKIKLDIKYADHYVFDPATKSMVLVGKASVDKPWEANYDDIYADLGLSQEWQKYRDARLPILNKSLKNNKITYPIVYEYFIQ